MGRNYKHSLSRAEMAENILKGIAVSIHPRFSEDGSVEIRPGGIITTMDRLPPESEWFDEDPTSAADAEAQAIANVEKASKQLADIKAAKAASEQRRTEHAKEQGALAAKESKDRLDAETAQAAKKKP